MNGDDYIEKLGGLKDFRGVYRNSNQLSSFLLNEAYIRKDNIDWLKAFQYLKKYLIGELSQSQFLKYCDKNRIRLEIVNGEGLIGGQFDVNDRNIIIQVTLDVVYEIMEADPDVLNNLANNFWANFTHEDTHLQQQSKSRKNIFEKYKSPTVSDWNEDLGKNLEYFNQKIEADAYGREIGARLEKIYTEKGDSKLSIMMDVNHNKIEDKYSRKIINVYKDPRVSRDANHSFFRALYDFLTEEKAEK